MTSRSEIWKFFDYKDNRTGIQCKFCSYTYNGICRSTSNLWNHLRNKHANQMASILDGTESLDVDSDESNSSERRSNNNPEDHKKPRLQPDVSFVSPTTPSTTPNPPQQRTKTFPIPSQLLDFSYMSPDPIACLDEEYQNVFKVWALKLKNLDPLQRKFAEKAVNDVLFEADLGNLHRDCVQFHPEKKPIERTDFCEDVKPQDILLLHTTMDSKQ